MDLKNQYFYYFLFTAAVAVVEPPNNKPFALGLRTAGFKQFAGKWCDSFTLNIRRTCSKFRSNQL